MTDARAGVAFPPSVVRELFPFLLAMDREMRIVQFGTALPKVCENVKLGIPMADVATLERPRVPLAFDALCHEHRSPILLASRTRDLRLRGQMVHEPTLDVLLFIGAPWITSIEQLGTTTLRLDDFTIHDPIVDFLYMVQAQSLALADARKFSETIAQQRDALEHSNRELARASKAKSQFLATTSHELRTPLNGILGMATLLGRSALTNAQQNQVEKIIRSGRALLTVLNDVLDFSKIEAGRLDLECSEFDIAQLAHEVSELFAPQAESKGVELVCDFEGTPPGSVRGDPNRLRQVLSNLIGNAVKFTDKGEIIVRLISREVGPDALDVRFEVADTGIGIPRESRGGLFRAFSQVDASMTRRHGGTGLGLAICKQLATLMGGDIGVDSEPGRGSTFWFSVRLAKVPGTDTRKSLPAMDGLDRARILVVDDSATARKFLVESAARWGLRCDEAESAVRGLELLRAAHAAGDDYRVAVLDAQMPGMTGTDLLLVLAGDASFERVRRVLLVSAEQEQAGHGALVRQGADRLLAKPVRASQLYDCLATLVTQGSVPRSATVAPSRERRPTIVPRSARASGRVLVVDDNEINLDVATAMLDLLGYDSDTVTDGHAAVEAACARPYALVLMDLQMPVLDGYAAVARLRARESNGRRTPVVALTAHAMDADRARAMDAGMDDYLSKPLSIEALGAALHRWIPAEGTPAEPPDANESDPTGVIDLAALEQVRAFQSERGPDLLASVVGKYLAELPIRAGAVRAGLDTGDVDAAASGAHALKSSSALVGAKNLSRICADVEALGERGRDAELRRSLAAQFDLECHRVRGCLTAFVRERVSPQE